MLKHIAVYPTFDANKIQQHFMDHLQSHIKGFHHQYDKDKLLESDLTATPTELFSRWLQMAIDEEVQEPIAMNLATVDEKGQPSSRIVLMRSFDENGFIFFTNYNSRKGRQLGIQPKVALNFFWEKLHKQVRIEGTAKPVSTALSDEYFHSRPRESQLGAWASEQSMALTSRNELDDRFVALEVKYKDQPIPRPPHWGGYQVIPHLFEFWQGRPNRLHDRFQFISCDNSWKVSRLSP